MSLRLLNVLLLEKKLSIQIGEIDCIQIDLKVVNGYFESKSESKGLTSIREGSWLSYSREF